jgi:hypothetical protein
MSHLDLATLPGVGREEVPGFLLRSPVYEPLGSSDCIPGIGGEEVPDFLLRSPVYEHLDLATIPGIGGEEVPVFLLRSPVYEPLGSLLAVRLPVRAQHVKRLLNINAWLGTVLCQLYLNKTKKYKENAHVLKN